MKKTPKKLKLDRSTIAVLNLQELRGVAGGQPIDRHTKSACAGQSCETDAYTQCMSYPVNCW